MKIKRIISGILSVCLAVTAVFPAFTAVGNHMLFTSAYEENIPYTDGIFTYTVTEGSVYILGCDAEATEAVIPDTIEGLPVTHVVESTFQNCSELTSVTLPASMQYLGYQVFSDCPKLREVIFPPSVTCLARSNFEGSPWWEAQIEKNEFIIVNGILLAGSGKDNGECIIPEGVTKIGDYAFSNNENLTAVQFPSTLKEIGDGAFIAASMTEVTFPDGLTTIGNDAFQDCEKLTEVTFPSSLSRIGTCAFLSTPWLTAQQMKSPLVIANGMLIDSSAASGDVILPDTVTAIMGGAISRNGEITSLTVPDSVTSLGDNFCVSCKKLQSVTLPSHLTIIPSYCLAGCPSLTTVTIPENVTVIDSYAFSGCQNLSEIELPPTLKAVNFQAFSGCTGLTEITLPKEIKDLDHAFTGCSGLTEILLPETIEKMNCAFNDCTGLTAVSVPGSVREMERAFSGCKRLTSVTISEGVTNMDGAFGGCNSLESVTVASANKTYSSADGVLFSKDGTKLLLYPQAKKDAEYMIPESVAEVANSAFANAKHLTSVTMPEHISSIGSGTFYQCSSLKQLTIPEGVMELEGVVSGCSALETLTLPKSLKKINQATIHCANLKDVYYPGSIQDWSYITVNKGNDTLYQAKIHFGAEDTAVHQNVTLYTAVPSSIVPAENTSYQIPTVNENAAFRIIAGNAAEVSETGLVTPTKNCGETIIRLADGEQVSFLHVTTADYAPMYADKRITAFLNDNITDDMTDVEKLEVIGKLPASMDYNYDHWDYIEMLAYNTGNCAGSATMLVEMCNRLGIRAWVRNADRDPGAGSAHVNALAEVDGVYYELEAGYEGKAPRSFTITKRTSLYKYQDAADGIGVYQYDGIHEAMTALEIPDSIDGKTVTRIGDGFLTENPWVKNVTIPDTVTEISENAFPDFKGILFGRTGTAAEKFAAEHGIAFRAAGSLNKGDVNADLEVDILDVIALNKYILGVSALNPTQADAADADENHKVDSADSLMIMKYVLELVDSLG